MFDEAFQKALLFDTFFFNPLVISRLEFAHVETSLVLTQVLATEHSQKKTKKRIRTVTTDGLDSTVDIITKIYKRSLCSGFYRGDQLPPY